MLGAVINFPQTHISACKVNPLGEGQFIACGDKQCRLYEGVTGYLADQLVAAAYAGNEGRVEEVLNNGAIVDKPSKELGHSALLAAVSHGQEAVVLKLIERQAIVDQEGIPGGTALISSINGGSLKIAELLLQNGASIDQATTRDRRTALMHAAHQGRLDFVVLFLAHNADVNKVDSAGLSALAQAAIMGNQEIVLALLKQGADAANAKNAILAMYDSEERKLKASRLLEIFHIIASLKKVSLSLALEKNVSMTLADNLNKIESLLLKIRQLPFNHFNFREIILRFHEIRDLANTMDRLAQTSTNESSSWMDLSMRLIPALRDDREMGHPTWDDYFQPSARILSGPGLSFELIQ